MRKTSKGQSLLEYSILMIIILACLLSMEQYMKRAFQGRMKTTVDSLGDQYDPRTANLMTNYTLNSSANSYIDIVPVTTGGFWTRRTDTSRSVETKGGQTNVGAIVNGATVSTVN